MAFLSLSFRTVFSLLLVSICILFSIRSLVTAEASSGQDRLAFTPIHESFLTVTSDEETNAIDVNSIVIVEQSDDESANPDEATSLIQYTVVNGDTISSIASRFGTTIDHLMKVNGLTNNTLRVGEKLHITPIDGFVIELDRTTNPLVFANQYNLLLDDVLSVNGFTDKVQRIDKGEEIFVPLSREKGIEVGLLPPPEPIFIPTQNNKEQRTVVTRKPTNGTIKKPNIVNGPTPLRVRYLKQNVVEQRVYTKNINNRFTRGYCTWYAGIKASWAFPYISDTQQYKTRHGDARARCGGARARGFVTSSKPSVGSIFVITQGGGGAGHVGIVTQVDRDGQRIMVEDMNYAGRYIVTRRWIPMNESMTQPTANSLPFSCFIPKQKLPEAVQNEINKL